MQFHRFSVRFGTKRRPLGRRDLSLVKGWGKPEVWPIAAFVLVCWGPDGDYVSGVEWLDESMTCWCSQGVCCLPWGSEDAEWVRGWIELLSREDATKRCDDFSTRPVTSDDFKLIAFMRRAFYKSSAGRSCLFLFCALQADSFLLRLSVKISINREREKKKRAKMDWDKMT